VIDPVGSQKTQSEESFHRDILDDNGSQLTKANLDERSPCGYSPSKTSAKCNALHFKLCILQKLPRLSCFRKKIWRNKRLAISTVQTRKRPWQVQSY
jgi:hypothetical protein